MISNLQNQNSEIWYWSWSGLDLTISLSLDECLTKLLQAICLYTEYVHIKAKYKNHKHKDVEDDL